MAKPDLWSCIKFKRLCRDLGLPQPYIVGLLETLWHAAYATSSPYLGAEADDVEIAAEWPGKKGTLCSALVASRFVDQDDSGFYIHDFDHHAPDYVKKRIERRKDKGLQHNPADNGRQRQPNGRQNPPIDANVNLGNVGNIALNLKNAPSNDKGLCAETGPLPTHTHPPHPPTPTHQAELTIDSLEYEEELVVKDQPQEPIRESFCPSSDEAGRTITELDQIYNAYPVKSAPVKAKREIAQALRRIERPDRIAWLLGQVQAFAASPVGQGRYCKDPAKWFADGCYDDDPVVWQKSDRAETPDERKRKALPPQIPYAGGNIPRRNPKPKETPNGNP